MDTQGCQSEEERNEVQKPVGVLSVFSPKTSTSTTREATRDGEQEINEKQAEIEECASDLPIVCTFVTQRRQDATVHQPVKDSIANETTRRKEGDKDWDRLAADDAKLSGRTAWTSCPPPRLRTCFGKTSTFRARRCGSVVCS